MCIRDSAYAAGLTEVAKAYPSLSIGSYPSFIDNRFRNQIVVRGKVADEVQAGIQAVAAMLKKLTLDTPIS